MLEIAKEEEKILARRAEEIKKLVELKKWFNHIEINAHVNYINYHCIYNLLLF